MPKKLVYTEGPLVMDCGAAGEFRIGIPKEVPDDLAEILLKKGRHKECVEEKGQRGKGAKAQSEKEA